MGYARILSGGEDGRYSIELDYGEAQKTALLAALTTLLGQLDAAIAAQQVLVTEADVKEAAQIVKVEAAQAAVIAAAASLPPGSPRPDTLGFKFELAQLAQMKKRHAPLRLKLDALKFDRAQALRRVAYWTDFNPIETRSAWCADLTEDAAADSYVATADIPGESNVIVLAPGCRPWAAGDGILTAREIMSPSQAFLNAAILPGWQKYFPAYRWGTCTAIDEDADTMSVSLASQPSSAQSLGINQASTLTGVPVVFMSCNARAFEVGDRVVVQFIGQSWTSPRVIGFLDNPKPCDFPCIYKDLSSLTFASNRASLFEQIVAGSMTIEMKLNGAAWRSPDEFFSSAAGISLNWYFPNGLDPLLFQGFASLSAIRAGEIDSYRFFPDVVRTIVSATYTIVDAVPVPHDNIAEFRIRTVSQTVFNIAMQGPLDVRLKTRGAINLLDGSEAVGSLDYELTG